MKGELDEVVVAYVELLCNNVMNIVCDLVIETDCITMLGFVECLLYFNSVGAVGRTSRKATQWLPRWNISAHT